MINKSKSLHVVQIDERIIDSNDLNRVLFDGSTSDQTANATESIDTNFSFSHCELNRRAENSSKADCCNLKHKMSDKSFKSTIYINHETYNTAKIINLVENKEQNPFMRCETVVFVGILNQTNNDSKHANLLIAQ